MIIARRIAFSRGRGLATVLLAATACTMGQRAAEPAPLGRSPAADAAASSATDFLKQRAVYRIKAEQTLNDLSAKIAELRTQAPSDPDQLERHLSMVAQLEDQLAKARDDLAALKDATAESWADRQQSVEQSVLLVKSAYDVARTRSAH